MLRNELSTDLSFGKKDKENLRRINILSGCFPMPELFPL